MLINTVEVYYNSVLTLYVKGSVLKMVMTISVVSIAVSEWLKALLASFVLVEVTLLNIKSLKVVK